MQLQTKRLIERAKANPDFESEDCKILWSKTFVGPLRGKPRIVCTPMICKYCGKKRLAMTSTLIFWVNSDQPFRGLCHACYCKPNGRRRDLRLMRMMKAKPESEEIGMAVVYWHTLKCEGKKNLIFVLCKGCGEKRFQEWQNIRKIGHNGVTGLCRRCAGKRVSGDKHRNWKGGRNITRDGYVQVYVAPEDPYRVMATRGGNGSQNMYVMEHRLVVAKRLGRALRSWEHVHHINGKKTDNRSKNLELVNRTDHYLITRLEQRIKLLEALLTENSVPVPR